MALHNEIEFENDICRDMAKAGWLYAEGDAANYDRKLALMPVEVLAWMQESQPEAWEKLEKLHGPLAGDKLLARLRDTLDKQGTLSVLREGFDMVGLKRSASMAQFRPASGLNPEIVARYEKNRLRVVRQVKYSPACENSLDLVLFLNGIPVATVELKTEFTQSLENAVRQYKEDRNPSPPGQQPEPLLTFFSGALVHFAVTGKHVKMTTRLAGPDTQFLPFDRGCDGGAGNTLNADGYATSYLWEEVWQRDSWLEILGRYMVAEKDEKQRVKALIFPRYHQLDATRRLRAAVLEEGPGKKYLIQHSAGSGKTKSIAWTAHFLADLHDAADTKVFDTIIVVSDRKVIDGQLQEAIAAFERKQGVVEVITGKSGSKSGALAEALSGNKKVVVCTIQTFPFALKAVSELAATEGKQFAVIADEAHSSQSGEAASKLKQILSAEELAELDDGGGISNEDILAAQMAGRAAEDGITYIAFTATPKAKTLEIFGRPENPTQPPSETNLPQPFHVYSMQQAIEEEFILDVLKNYTTYKMAFKLAKEGGLLDESEVERSAATKKLMNWVRLHEHNIAQRVEIVVEHYRETVAPLLNGKAKAMVVVSSRQEAVRWQRATQKYIDDQGYALQSLVAFSGEVNDEDTDGEPVRETSPGLNPGLDGRDIATAFNDDAYQILLVANKFQTGFDQPLLCGMYVDKRLAGIQAVQTLSRLNRCHPGKEETYVLDFVNEPEEILDAFKTYYRTAELATTTDPNLILDLRAKLDATGFYDEFEIDRVVAVTLTPKPTQKQLEAAIQPVAQRLVNRFSEAKAASSKAEQAGDAQAMQAAKDTMDALVLFRADASTYLRAYAFLSQMFDYGNTDLEKRAIFYKYLVRLLKFGLEKEGIDLSDIRLTHHSLNKLREGSLNLSGDDAKPLTPMTEAGSGSLQEKEKAALAEIIARLNEAFGGDTTDGDQVSYAKSVGAKALESDVLQQQADQNSKEQFAASPDFDRIFMEAVIESLDAQSELGKRTVNSPEIRESLKRILLDHLGLYEKLQARATAL